MRADNHLPVPSHESRLSVWVRRSLRLYPRVWRARYADEVAAVLAEHRVTLWTVLDVLLGALDAHTHRDMLPGRLLSMAHRIRSSEIAVFCAFVLFCVAWLPLLLVRDPLTIWNAAVAAHPELSAALTVLDLVGVVATLAVLVGGLPVFGVALMHSVAARRWRVLTLFAVPPIAVAALILGATIALPASVVRQSSAPDAPFTPLAIALQLGLIALLLLAIGGSAAAVAAAIGQSELGRGMLRFALVPAGVVVASLALGLVAAIVLTILIFAEAPQVASWLPFHVGALLVMLVAAVVGGVSIRHGIDAARGGEGAV